MKLTAELIEQVTRQVLQSLQGKPEWKLKILLLGDSAEREQLAQRYCIYTVEDYATKPDLSDWELVLIGSMGTAQLADIALGRDDTPFTHAVCSALLVGKPVYLLPEALSYRARQGSASPKLFALLESYVRQLEAFGVQFCSPSGIGQGAGSQNPNLEKAEMGAAAAWGLITADRATQLAKTYIGEIQIEPGTILTPLARDVFREKRIQIQYN